MENEKNGCTCKMAEIENGIFRYDTCLDKQQTRPLYENVFADGKAFTDFYYKEKCRYDNHIFVKKIANEVVAMLHLIPYVWQVGTVQAQVHYVFAVATAQEHRKKGYMDELMQAAFVWMRKKQVALCYLIPVNPEVYSKYGFAKICDFHIPQPQEHMDEQHLAEQYDIYVVRDEQYRKLEALKQQAIALDGEDGSEGIPDSPIVMAKILDAAAVNAWFGVKQQTGQELLEQFRQKKIYICEDV